MRFVVVPYGIYLKISQAFALPQHAIHPGRIAIDTDIKALQKDIDLFLSTDPQLACLANSGQIQIRLEPTTNASRAKLAMILVSPIARAAGLSPSPGHRVMERLCLLCSERGIDLELLARPLASMPIPGVPPTVITLDKLCTFYESFGFKEGPGQTSRLSRRMSRPSQPEAHARPKGRVPQ